MEDLAKALSGIPWEKLGIVSVLSGFIYGFYRRWWVPGYIYDKAVSDRDQAIKDRDQQTGIASDAVKALSVLTEYFRVRGGRER